MNTYKLYESLSVRICLYVSLLLYLVIVVVGNNKVSSVICIAAPAIFCPIMFAYTYAYITL